MSCSYITRRVFPIMSDPDIPQASLSTLLYLVARLMAEARGLLPPILTDPTITPSRIWPGLELLAWSRPLDPAPLSNEQLMLGLNLLHNVNWAAADPRLLGDLYTSLTPQRRRLAGYYTPPGLARTIAERTLAPLLTSDPFPLRILDPAMGSGHFLITAGELIADHLTANDPTRRRLAALRCLHGVDSDPFAVELAGLGLWLWAAVPGTLPAMLKDHLLCDDTLLAEGDPFASAYSSRQAGYDAVIGNPPYASVFTRAHWQSTASAHRAVLQARYQTAVGSFDLYVPFVERSITLCRSGGRCGLVLPNKLLAADYARPLRRWLAEHTVVEAIIDYSAHKPFEAAVYPVAIVFRRQAPSPSERLHIYRADRHLSSSTQSELHGTPATWSAVLDPTWPELRRCLSASVPLAELANLMAGLTVAEAYDLRPHVIESSLDHLPDDMTRLLISGLITRYRTSWGQASARYLKACYRRPAVPIRALPPRRREQATAPKIVVAGLARHLRAVVDPGAAQASVGTTVIIPHRWPLGALCALLNSRLASRLYIALFGGLALNGGYLRIAKRELARLPVPDLPPNDPRLACLDALAARAAVEGLDPSLDDEIEALVRHLYGLG